MSRGLRMESISQYLHSYYSHAGSFEADAQQLGSPTCLRLEGSWVGVGSCWGFLEAILSPALSVKMLGNSSGQQSQKRGNVTQLLK